MTYKTTKPGFIMLSPYDTVGGDIIFSGCPSVPSFFRSSGQILLPRYLINGSSNLDETYRKYSLAPTDELIRFWR